MKTYTLTGLALILAASWAFAQTPPTPSTSANSASAMSPSNTPAFRDHTLAENPDLTPEEIGRRFLKLVDSLHSFSDLTLERMRKVTGLPMYYVPASSSYGFGMHLPESGWYYYLSYSDYPQDLKNASYDFHNKDRIADMGPVCGMDYDAYATALQAIGFKERPDLAQYDIGPDGIHRMPEVAYTRNDVMVKIFPSGQAVAPEAKLHHSCVKSICVIQGVY